VKIDEYPYWPGKVLGLDKSKKTAIVVCFFDNNQYYDIKLYKRSIRIYTKTSPDRGKVTEVEGLKEAIKVSSSLIIISAN